MSPEHRVTCNFCENDFRPVMSKIRLICNGCLKEAEKEKKEIIADLKEFRRTHSIHLDLVDIINKWEERVQDATRKERAKCL